VGVGGGGLVAFSLLREVEPQVAFGASRLTAVGEKALGRAVAGRRVVWDRAGGGG
jgi:hypothetical protein